MTTPEEIRTRLQGPVASIPTPFDADGEIDRDGVANIIDTAIAGGSGVILLTVGDSQYYFLTDAEIAALTRFTVEHTAGRALLVAATGDWATRQAVPFAEYCRELGADVLMSLPPAQMTSGSGLVDHYRALAAVMPVMIVGAPDLSVVERLTDEPAICCFKEDGTEAYALTLLQKYGRQWKIMTGGGLYRHLFQWPFGAQAFMDWTTSCVPQIGFRYWQALQHRNLAEAARITREIEAPLFELTTTLGVDWQALWRAMLELNGVAKRYLRSPMVTMDEETLEKAHPLLRQFGVCP
ncbi:MAG: dihydrodipicolinate synthase family protein [Armatimonadota bacterium]